MPAVSRMNPGSMPFVVVRGQRRAVRWNHALVVPAWTRSYVLPPAVIPAV